MVAFTVVSIADISEQLQQDILLTTYRIMVESAPNAMVLVDEAGRIDLVNEHTEVLFGYMREELMGMPVTLLLPIDFDRVKESLRGTPPIKATSSVFQDGHEPHGRTKDGRDVALQIGFNPMMTNAGTMVVASLVDITDRKRAEAELRSALHSSRSRQSCQGHFFGHHEPRNTDTDERYHRNDQHPHRFEPRYRSGVRGRISFDRAANICSQSSTTFLIFQRSRQARSKSRCSLFPSPNA